jgi:hypothetical protein
MNIFFGSSQGRADVPAASPVGASLETALEIFRTIDPGSGFLGINLDERCVVQFAPRR